jgi:hypothetical protein
MIGKIHELPDKDLTELYCRRHPPAERYARFADFSFWRMAPEKVHVIDGFGRIETMAAVAVFPGLV